MSISLIILNLLLFISIRFVKKYFEVQLLSILNLDGNIFTWCNIMQQCVITIHPCCNYEHFSKKEKYFLFKPFVKTELSYVFTINMFSTSENCMEK